MAYRPAYATFTNVSVDTLNAIRNGASQNYRNYVPVATADAYCIRKIGTVLCDNPALANEFYSALIGRIAKVIITNKLFQNPWEVFKKGIVELGETIEDVFVELAKPHTFDPDSAPASVLAREKAEVLSTFYVMNYQKFYKNTFSMAELRTAFTTIDGVTDLLTKTTEAMYSAANLDEFLTMKYLLAKRILAGQMFPSEVSAVSAANAKSIVATIKGVSNDIEFPSRDYNLRGVYNKTDKAEQYIIMNSKFDALIDVEVLASAFNMSKAEFLGHRILVDDFGKLDDERLTLLFANDPNYVALTSAEKSALSAIPCVLVDKGFFQIYDNLIDTGELYNPETLSWNYWLHRWATYGTSPYVTAVVFVAGTPAVTAITVSPASATVAAGGTVQLVPTVTASNFAPQSVTYSSSDETVATVDTHGLVTVKSTATSASTATITVKSVYTPSVTATVVITVA